MGLGLVFRGTRSWLRVSVNLRNSERRLRRSGLSAYQARARVMAGRKRRPKYSTSSGNWIPALKKATAIADGRRRIAFRTCGQGSAQFVPIWYANVTSPAAIPMA